MLTEVSSLELTEWSAYFKAREVQSSGTPAGSTPPPSPEYAAALDNPDLLAALADRDARHRAGRDGDPPGVVAPVVLE